MQADNDQVLIDRCRRGERSAWCTLVARYDRFVFSVATSTGLDRDDAFDVAQVTFSALLEAIDKLQPDSRLAAWLATVAKRQSWRLLAQRRRERTGASEDVAWSANETQTAEFGDIRHWEDLHGLTCALEQLDQRCRRLLTALYFEPDEPSYEDIAKQFDMPVGSIGPTRARCLKRLKKIFDTLEPETG